jgi:hypothetical protein
MKLDIDNRDLWAGLMFAALGAASIWLARDYAYGSALRMGPGYFPTLLGGILIAFGVYLAIRGLRSGEKIAGGWSPRALIVVPLAMVLFGFLMQHAGFVPALAAVIFISAAASPQFKLIEVAALTVVLTVASVALFIFGLQLPYPLIAGH